MSEEKAQTEVSTPSYQGVSVDHPRVVDTIKNCKKQGMTKEQAQKIVGMPMEIIDKVYNRADK